MTGPLPALLSAAAARLAAWATLVAAPAGVIAVAAVAALASPPAAASSLDLSVTVRPAGREAQVQSIAMSDLAAMPQQEVRAVTPWTEGVVVFEGVPFADLAARVGVSEGPVALIALNAYQITLDAAQVIRDGGVLALKMDGRTMSVRDKGPIWLVFPSEARPELAATDNTHMWIWQVNAIEFGPR
ncbi:hypothetical protein P2H44_07075 [Albimonas sp. CAU 1670]|uniref:hypothetical protein n=1 Tax=Albimonas sp. CAU 1670 TaxID=3032599 RepID=UPI0023DC2B4D|nr:hypothetical protein [Albimonas sp. CAU 1670]MDF2232315.1 hypothetical protein [Albimonas sp. CAU 1670]